MKYYGSLFSKPFGDKRATVFLKVIYLSDILKSELENVASLFLASDTGRQIFRPTMLSKRFLFILKAIGFYNVACRRDIITESVNWRQYD